MFTVPLSLSIYIYLQTPGRAKGINILESFYSGVSYIIDTLQDSCQITQLGFGGYAFVHYLNHGMVQMMTPAEFISGGSLTQYTYAGVVIIKNMKMLIIIALPLPFCWQC